MAPVDKASPTRTIVSALGVLHALARRAFEAGSWHFQGSISRNAIWKMSLPAHARSSDAEHSLSHSDCAAMAILRLGNALGAVLSSHAGKRSGTPRVKDQLAAWVVKMATGGIRRNRAKDAVAVRQRRRLQGRKNSRAHEWSQNQYRGQLPQVREFRKVSSAHASRQWVCQPLPAWPAGAFLSEQPNQNQNKAEPSCATHSSSLCS